LNRAEEDYIKTIYELTSEKNIHIIKTNDLVERLGFTDQTVNEMIKKLNKKNLVSFIPYKGVSLTKKGLNEAIRMVRTHRIWEVFLTEKLGFSWEDVHEDAELLEHATSKKVLDKLYHFLGEPKYCQHGNPIPDEKGIIHKRAHKSLNEMNEKDRFKITRVHDLKELLVFLNQQEIKLDDEYEIVEKDDFNQIIKIRKSNKINIISYQIAKMIFGIKV
jgi:DtxR family Mn-dependent transcriptional regulator